MPGKGKQKFNKGGKKGLRPFNGEDEEVTDCTQRRTASGVRPSPRVLSDFENI